MLSTRMFGNSPNQSYLRKLNKNITNYSSPSKKGMLSNIYSSQQKIYNTTRAKKSYIANYRKSVSATRGIFPKLSMNTALLKKTLTNKKHTITSFLNKTLSYNPPKGFMQHSYLGRNINIMG